jgi:LPS export ABC transporter protein LptC
MAVLIAALALALAVAIFRGFDANKTLEEEPAPPSKVDVTLKKVRYTETSDGTKKWTLVADGVDYWRESETSRLENIKITFFRPDSGNDVLLTAHKGKFQLDSREVEVWGDVELQTDDGMTFRTERAFYSERKHQISSKDKVYLASEGISIYAIGMRYNLETRRLNLLSGVKADIVAADIAENKE